VRAARRLGELLRDNIDHDGMKGKPGPGRGNKNGYRKDRRFYSDVQSSRWQRMATVPEADFEAEIAKRRESQEMVTEAAIARLAKEKERQHKRDTAPIQRTCTVKDLEKLIAVGAKFKTIYADPPWAYDETAN
jgi:hypothetical protein